MGGENRGIMERVVLDNIFLIKDARTTKTMREKCILAFKRSHIVNKLVYNSNIIIRIRIHNTIILTLSL